MFFVLVFIACGLSYPTRNLSLLIVVLVFFGFLFVFVCSFACPKGRMQRVDSCHLFAVLHAPREGCRELTLVICLQFCMPQGKDAES